MALEPEEHGSPAPNDPQDKPRYLRSSDGLDPGKPQPLYCVWELTLQCDLGCKHCGSRAGVARPGELSTDECLSVVGQLADLGIREVTLIGGEAYLRDDWHLIAAEIVRLGMGCSMTTGARELGADRIAQAVDAGMGSISVSIDGLQKTHDSLRGVTGSWQAAVDASRRIAQTPIRLTTNTQINQLSMPELPAIAELLSEIGSVAWQVQLTVSMGRAGDRPYLLLQPHDLLELFPLLVWIEQNRLTPNGIGLFPGNNVGYFSPYADLLKVGGDGRASWNGCSAGQWTLGLEADGTIKGCPSLQTIPYAGGNLKKDNLKKVVEDSPQLRSLRDRTRDDLWGFCKTCVHADTCKAGCSWTSHSLFGKPGNNPYCIHRALELEGQGIQERIQIVEMPPGVPFDNGRYEIIVEQISETNPSPTISGIELEEIKAANSRTPGLSTGGRIQSALTRGVTENEAND